jgi:hypothetical protein
MLRKLLLACGLSAPILYVITVIAGAALRPDYSHITNAISELLSNGAPNKVLLDLIFNIYGALLLLFAVGGYLALKEAPHICRAAMVVFIAIQIFSFSWGFFPMDASGAPATFAGVIHNTIGGIVAFSAIMMPLMMGFGMRRVGGSQAYAAFALTASAIIFCSGLLGIILAGQGIPVFGLFERITIGSYEIWIFVTATKLLKQAGWKSKPDTTQFSPI